MNTKAPPRNFFIPLFIRPNKTCSINNITNTICQPWRQAANLTEADGARLPLLVRERGERFSATEATPDGRNLTVALRPTDEMNDPTQAFQVRLSLRRRRHASALMCVMSSWQGRGGQKTGREALLWKTMIVDYAFRKLVVKNCAENVGQVRVRNNRSAVHWPTEHGIISLVSLINLLLMFTC